MMSYCFNIWFGKSAVVDAAGAPLVVYHGSAHPSWSEGRNAFGPRNGMGEGAYFTPSAETAAIYAQMDGEVEGDAEFLVPVYLSIQNPKIIHDSIEMQAITPVQRAQWEAEGHDGMMGYYKGVLAEIVVWHPTQIKAAFGNSGAYDPTDPDITDRRAAAAHEALVYLATKANKAAYHA